MFDWHEKWFAQKSYHGCLFMRAASELGNTNNTINTNIEEHKNWLLALIEEKIQSSEKARLIMLLLEGLINIHLIYPAHHPARTVYLASAR